MDNAKNTKDKEIEKDYDTEKTAFDLDEYMKSTEYYKKIKEKNYKKSSDK